VMASSVDRRIEGDLSEDMGQRDPASLIRPRSTEPIRACGLPPRQQAGHMTASDLRFQYAKFSLRAGGHPHMSSGRPKAGLVGRRTARLRGGRAQARRHRLRAHAAAGRARQGSYKARVVRIATPCCRRSCSSCCAPSGERAASSACCCRGAGCFRAATRSSRSRPDSSIAPSMPPPRPLGSKSESRRTPCGTALPPICWSRRPISASSRCCSKRRHTARQHPIEGRIYYPFHPRCGETVLIVRQYAYQGAELVVIPQPDGSVACIPCVDDVRIGGASRAPCRAAVVA